MRKTVLTVDDSATVRDVSQKTLHNAGYQFVLPVASRAVPSILTYLKAVTVVTDLNMPHMEGILLIGAIRSQLGLIVSSQSYNLISHECSQ